MLSLKRIIVPTDYSAFSANAFRYALQLAPNLAAVIDVIHVWSAPYFGPEYEDLPVGDERKSLFALIRDRANEEMAQFVSQETVPENVQVNTHVHSGEPTQTLLQLAAQLPADLIIAGTHGRTGAKYLLLGSVATRLVRYAPCPVLCVPAPHEHRAGA